MSSENESVLLHGNRFHVVRIEQSTPHGPGLPREVIRHPGSVVILPLVDDHTVCLIRNFRIAVNQTLIELPAGTLEADEDPQATAQRELIEETGYRAQRMEELHAFYAAPGILDEKMTLFLARGLAPGQPDREVGEEIENLVVPWQQAIEMVSDGRIRDAKSIVGLLYYDTFLRNREPAS